MRSQLLDRVMRSFVQEAEGKFSIRLHPNTPHCGYSNATWAIAATFEYRLILVWSVSALDSNGFLLDNTYFGDYFLAFRDSLLSVSCERFAQLIADDMVREAGTRGLVRCDVRLSAIPGVWITATCQVQQ